MRLSIILDVDDVLLKFNEDILHSLNKEKHTNYQLEDISSWSCNDKPELNERFKYVTKTFFLTQTPYPGVKEFISKLSSMCEIFIHTAVSPEYIPERNKRILELFPEINPDNILYGNRKDLSRATFMLDDNPTNILDSNADVPILFRQPWNQNLTGLVAVNTYDDVLELINLYINSFNPNSVYKSKSIIALIGPSGSGKTEIAKKVSEAMKYETPVVKSTKMSTHYHYCEETEFIKLKKNNSLLEYSVYGNYLYGIDKESIDNCIKVNSVIIPLDITGILMLKQFYPVYIVYVDKDKKEIIENILTKRISVDEQVNRILAIDSEKSIKNFADMIISDGNELIEFLSKN